MSFPSFLKQLCILFVLSISTNKAEAAIFSLGGDAELNCSISLVGTIQDGDAARLRTFVRENWKDLVDHDTFFSAGERRLCLNSEGGSVRDAIEIIDTLVYGLGTSENSDGSLNLDEFLFFRALGTAVPSGSTCQSACALIFMSGGWFNRDAGRIYTRLPDRVLHVDASLGFHAPWIWPEGESYSKVDMSYAYSLAISFTKEITDRSRAMYFSPSLFSAMVSTPPEEMFFIETVAQAGGWGIQLHGVPKIDGASIRNLENICKNIELFGEIGFRQRERYGDLHIPSTIRSRGSGFYPGFFGSNFTFRHSFSGLEFFNQSSQQRYARQSTRFPKLQRSSDSWSECGIAFERATNHVEFNSLPRMENGFELVLLQNEDDQDRDYSWLLYPPYTKLDDLASINKEEVHGKRVVTSITQHGDAPCAEYTYGFLSHSTMCNFVIIIDPSINGLDLAQNVVVFPPEGTLFSYSIEIIEDTTSDKLVERLSPVAKSKFLGRLRTRSVDHRSPPPENLNFSSNRDGWGVCFDGAEEGSVWCFNDQPEFIPTMDTSLRMFPEY